MAELPIVQANIIVREDEGNAFAASAESELDALNERVLAYTVFELQDNRYGWVIVEKEHANGTRTGIAKVEVRVPEGLQKPDDVQMVVDHDTPRVTITAHQTSLTTAEEFGEVAMTAQQIEEAEAALDIEGRIITVAVREFPGLFVPRPAPAPAEEPIWCEDGNRPYLRVNQALKRGGALKLMVLGFKAALTQPNFWDDIPPGQWTFQDVPPGSTHWDWTERMARAGAVAGTPCVPRP